jgi:hypothetical protein
MAIITEANQRIIKPDVYDVLAGEYDLSSEPVYNRLRKGPDVPDAKLFQWPFDVPDNPSNSGSPEGVEYTQAGTTQYGGRDLLLGRCHHQKEFFGVGEVAQGNQVYGTGGVDEFAYQLKRALKKLLKSSEYTVVGPQEADVGNGTDSFITRGLELWINFDVTGQTDTATACPAAFRTPTAQVVTMTVNAGDYPLIESNISTVFNSLFDTMKGKMDLDVFCTTTFKGKVSAFGNLQAISSQAALRRFNMDAEEKKIVAVIDTWVGDAGTARFELHPWLRFNTETQFAEALGLDFRYIQLRMRQAPKAMKLPPAGGGERGVASQTFGLQCTPKFLAKWKRSA